MKHILAIFFVLFFNYEFLSQTNHAKVIYSISIEELDDDKTGLDNDIASKKLFEDIEKKTKDLKLQLIYSAYKSVFKMKKPMNLDYQEELIYNIIGITFRINSNYYSSNKDNIIIEEKEFLGETFLIKSIQKNIKEENWKITSESKIVNNYKCFKATRKFTYISKGSKQSREQIVWFAPKISVQFGPKNFIGFPGLVLEVKDGNVNYIVDEISLNNKNTFEIKKPTKGKAVTKSEFKEIVNKASSFYKRN